MSRGNANLRRFLFAPHQLVCALFAVLVIAQAIAASAHDEDHDHDHLASNCEICLVAHLDQMGPVDVSPTIPAADFTARRRGPVPSDRFSARADGVVRTRGPPLFLNY